MTINLKMSSNILIVLFLVAAIVAVAYAAPMSKSNKIGIEGGDTSYNADTDDFENLLSEILNSPSDRAEAQRAMTQEMLRRMLDQAPMPAFTGQKRDQDQISPYRFQWGR